MLPEVTKGPSSAEYHRVQWTPQIVFGPFGPNHNTSICGLDGDYRNDRGPFVTSGSIAHTGNTVLVELVSRLNEAATNESLGIDAVEVWVY